jgi:hypothetical protein
MKNGTRILPVYPLETPVAALEQLVGDKSLSFFLYFSIAFCWCVSVCMETMAACLTCGSVTGDF